MCHKKLRPVSRASQNWSLPAGLFAFPPQEGCSTARPFLSSSVRGAGESTSRKLLIGGHGTYLGFKGKTARTKLGDLSSGKRSSRFATAVGKRFELDHDPAAED